MLFLAFFKSLSGKACLFLGLTLLFFCSPVYQANSENLHSAKVKKIEHVPKSLPVRPAQESDRYYVNHEINISGDGSSWNKAFKTITEALDAATDNDIIWVRKGIYLLTEQLKVDKAVFIYGGFAGNESALEEINWNHNQTIIDGQNQTRCLLITAKAHLEGLTITHGFTRDAEENTGGGIKIRGSSPVFKHCQFKENQADYLIDTDQPGLGGAVYIENGSPLFEDCTFEGNNAGAKLNIELYGHGGAIYIKDGCPRLLNCSFIQNMADGFGGAIYGKAIISDCLFSGNMSTQGGGAIFTDKKCLVNRTSFINNTTDYSGGSFQGLGKITNSRFQENYAADVGGALCITAASDIINTCFIGNVLTNSYEQNLGGGVIYLTKGTELSVINAYFSRNKIGLTNVAHGGAIYNRGHLAITNGTFWGNTTCTTQAGKTWYGKGGAIYHSGEGSLRLINSIFWGNIGVPAEIEEHNSPIEVSYCNIDQAGFSSRNNNLRQNPQFVAPLSDDFHLEAGSPCIDFGNNQALAGIFHDFDGNKRIRKGAPTPVRKGIVDLGAFEYQP